MDSYAYRYVVSFVGLVYGTMGYGLSILTCIFGAVLRHFLPEFAALPAPKLPRISRGRRSTRVGAQGSSPWKSRSYSKNLPSKPSAPGNSKISEVTGGTSLSLHPLIDNAQLRRVSSMGSLNQRQPILFVAPVITINHVDRVDNMSIHAPTITIHPNPHRKSEDQLDLKPPKALLTHPTSLPNLSHRRPLTPPDASRVAPGFRLANFRPHWSSEKPKIHRSASSPQLTEFIKEKRSEQDLCREKAQKSRKRLLKPNRSNSTNSPPSKFFSPVPKHVEKKRSQTLRTQPYSAPYFMPPPVPPIPHNVVRYENEARRSKTLPPEKS